MIFILYILEGLVVLIFFSVLVLLCMWAITGYRSKVPFTSVPSSILNDIYRILGIKEESVVYDLGCGDARVLFYAASRMPKATYMGIENSPLPLILSRVRAWWYKIKTGTKVSIINKDFFERDLSDATHIFTYLYPHVMDDLLPKFDRELKPGTRLVSASFKFTQKQPIAEFDLARGTYKLAQTLYVYEF